MNRSRIQRNVIVALTIVIAVLACNLYRCNKTISELSDKAILTTDLQAAVQMCGYEQSPTDIWSWESSLRKYKVDADIAFIGDSLTQRSDFTPYFPDVTVYNLGIGGDTIEGISSRITMIDAVQAEKTFIMAGFNDLQSNEPEDEIYDDIYRKYSALLDGLFSKYPNMTVYVESILPVTASATDDYGITSSMIQSADRAVMQAAADHNVQYIDLYSLYADKDGFLPDSLSADGVHITDSSYQIWADAIKKYVYE